MNNLGLQKVVLRRVTIYKVDKNGNPMKTKNGKPYVRVQILTDKHRDSNLSGMIFSKDDPRLLWAEGETVEIIVEKNGEYINFRVPSGFDKLEFRIERLEKEVFPKGVPETVVPVIEDNDPLSFGEPEREPAEDLGGDARLKDLPF